MTIKQHHTVKLARGKKQSKVEHFRKEVWNFYKKNRRDLPWRRTKNPYRILVSEIMLQQTQVARVIGKYNAWLKEFPTPQSLAEAELKNVIRNWQGLGYNRRALNLKRAAEKVSLEYKNKFPKEYAEILDLPGIGPYTAGAIMAFAYNKPYSIIETNIRTVFIHYFFNKKSGIDDKDILKLVEKTLDRKNPREWYYALMDYGTYLKKTHGNANEKSRHYTKQTKFKGSRREVRSAVLMVIASGARKKSDVNKILIKRKILAQSETVAGVISDLKKEGFVQEHPQNVLRISRS